VQPLYTAVVLAIGLTPAAFVYLNLSVTQRARLVLGAGLTVLPAALAFFISREASVGMSLGELAMVYYLASRRVTKTVDITFPLAKELKNRWAFVPKREKDRIALEKEAARLIERENGSFTLEQVYSVLARAYGEQATGAERAIKKEIAEWAKELKSSKSHYNLGGK
jgi:hypothetical protein